jgi:hypothetical protein
MSFVSTQETTVIAFSISGDYRVDVLLDGVGFRWNAPGALKSPVTVTFSFAETANYLAGDDAKGFLPFTDAERKAAREVLSLISSQFNISFTEVTETKASDTAFGQLRFSNSTQGVSSGYAYFPPQDGVGANFNGDNFINNDPKYLTDYSVLTPQGAFNWSLMIHEVLHSLGLKHPGNYNAGEPAAVVPGNYLVKTEDNPNNSVLSYIDNPQGLQRIDLGVYDMLAMNYLYGAKAYRVESNQYVFSNSAANQQAASSSANLTNTVILVPDTGRFLQLINDTGGDNFFNFQSMTAGVTVNLGQGKSSSAGFLADGKTLAIDNIQIAFGTEINTVFGSKYNDTLIGNLGANWLEGGSGNDTIDGAQGADMVQYNGKQENYLISKTSNGYKIVDKTGLEGEDTLTNVELVFFKDGNTIVKLDPAFHSTKVTEPYARKISSAVLFIDKNDQWNVGNVGDSAAKMVPVSYQGARGIDDNSYGLKAISAESTGDGGFALFLGSNTAGYFKAILDKTGSVTSVAKLTYDQLFSAEVTYNVDLNHSHGVGNTTTLLTEVGNEEIWVDGLGSIGKKILTADGSSQFMKFKAAGGADLKIQELTDIKWKITGAITENGITNLYGFNDLSKAYAVASYDASGNSINLNTLSSTQVASTVSAVKHDVFGTHNLNPNSLAWTSTLKTAYLQSYINLTLSIDGSMNHGDAVGLIDLVIKTESQKGGGIEQATISKDILNDLMTISEHGKSIFRSVSLTLRPNDYLSYVFGSMIEGSDANEFYTGGKSQPIYLGDLYAGDKVSKLQLLENKWLLGLDLPIPKVEGDTAKPGSTSATAVYKNFEGSLFIDGVKPTEVNQGGLGDCYFVSSLLLLARGAPEFLADAVVDNGLINGKQTWGIRFFDEGGTPIWVTVDKQLPVISSSNSKLLGTSTVTGELWIPIFEKAYTQANEIGVFGREDTDNAYYAIEGGQGDSLLSLTNANITVYQDFPYDRPSTVHAVFVDTKSKAKVDAAAKEIMAVLNAGGFAWIGCERDAFDSSGKLTFVGGHAMAVFDYSPSDPNNTTVYVYNPWGVSLSGADYASPFVVDIVTLVGGPQGLDIWLSNPVLG